MNDKLDKANQSIGELVNKIRSEKHSELLKQGRCPHWAGLPVNILGRGIILDNGDPVIVGVDHDGKFVVKVDDTRIEEE